ncbi:MAG TPA: DUF92 domain-containing protein [Chitinophagaceae bacterium]
MDLTATVFYIVLPVLTALTVPARKLDIPGALLAALLAALIYEGSGITGILLLGMFFFLAVSATSWKTSAKQASGFAEANKGRRNAAQVFANGGLAALLALFGIISESHQAIILVMIAGAFSSATADTVSAELGMIYGRRCYNITTLKPDVRGENGVISLEGTLFGVAGSLAIALVYVLSSGWHGAAFLAILVAGTVGNLADSFLGAVLERKHVIGNNAVNFLNTLVGAAVAGAMVLLLPR